MIHDQIRYFFCYLQSYDIDMLYYIISIYSGQHFSAHLFYICLLDCLLG